jgi:hypothetical protein
MSFGFFFTMGVRQILVLEFMQEFVKLFVDVFPHNGLLVIFKAFKE